MNDQYLSVSQVANLKGVSRNAVYKAVREGRLVSTKLVGVVAIRRSDAEAWSARSRTGRKTGKPTSEEAKAKISVAQRLRWQKRMSE